MKLTRKFAVMTPDKRQDPHMDGTGVRFETMEHGGEYPDTMPQAIKLIGLIAKDMRLTQRTNQRPSSAAVSMHRDDNRPSVRGWCDS